MDIPWAVMTIWGEARGESFEGKVAVACVIRHRTERKYSSDGTIPGTVLRDRQFSCWNANDPNRIKMATLDDNDNVVEECLRAWRTSNNPDNDNVPGAVLYLNKSIVYPLPNWAKEENEIRTIGAHTFYRDD